MTEHLTQGSGELAILGNSPTRPKPIESTVAVSALARDRLLSVIDSGLLSDYYNGPWARKFEEQFALYYGPRFRAVAVNSGTSALHIALAAAGIGPNDEVILPALCFVSAATAIVQCGAVPVICDAEPEYLTIDVEQVESLIGPRTKAILPVHFWGYPSDVSALRKICDRYALVLIEDCSQALGALVHGYPVGTFGDYATFAFSVRKHIACGEGGMVICKDENSYRRIRQLSNYGKGPGWDDYESLGYNYRMAELPAIIGLDGLDRLESETRARQQAGALYRELFGDSGLEVLAEPRWGHCAFFKCPILLPQERAELQTSVVKAIAAENVSCRIPHRPLFSIPWLSNYLRAKDALRGQEQCGVAASRHLRLLEIETGPNLPEEEVRVSSAAVLKVWRHYSV